MSTPDPEEKSVDFSVLLASSIHDIKNSLGFVLSKLDQALIEDSGRLEFSPELAVELNHEAKRANKALIQLLSLYRMESKQYVLQRQNVDIDDFFDDCRLRHDTLLKRKELALEVQVAQGLFAEIDPYLVEGVLDNLVINAMRFAQSRIRIAARMLDSADLEIRVEDDGPGFPEEVHTVGADGSVSHYRPSKFAAGDTKLGLYFCEMVAHLHQHGNKTGSICVSSGGELGGGIVAIKLPIAAA
ncbi:HAMP domain-containing histidine kinase [Halorhodospira halochloris]|uniref:Sensor histidine kinase n=1 Tax=Halorhodospira halochloris TaxID=1052 RepID=A0A120MZK3_HALHR|nr:HAMP domain-containing sensor histidine kinase [Halorhodospira halochloris]MCG5530154.1 HAMP domain-containing histidine kinase [Halorhodospira halochloris]MCG5548012.1 HAMP domain-containing histidine kinase [Halorhodospira halochloris]BAU57238.1 sensor histidine kinase [Halorhodospira halochloris]